MWSLISTYPIRFGPQGPLFEDSRFMSPANENEVMIIAHARSAGWADSTSKLVHHDALKVEHVREISNGNTASRTLHDLHVVHGEEYNSTNTVEEG
jgi:hypothetical protein